MLIKCCSLPSRTIKSAAKASGAQPRTPLGELAALPQPPAGFKPILCLVVFFIGPNCMRISSSPHFQMKIYSSTPIGQKMI